MPCTARHIAEIFETIAPLASGIPGDQLGFVYGDPETPIRGLGCMWNVHSNSIARTAERDLNMIICHEAIWLRPQASAWYVGPSEEQIRPNQLRRELLDRYGMVVYRSHSNWDALPVDGVADQAVAALGIQSLNVVAEQKFFKVHQLPEPMTVRALRNRVREGLGFHSCRVFGDEERHVQRFAFLIGGFGENQVHMPQVAMEMGAEAVIIGEMSEFIVVACLELGMPVIESLHSASESPAIRRQAQILAERLPDLRVEYVPSGAPSFTADQR